MLWAVFSILAALTWAVVNVVDKYVLTKWNVKPVVPVMVSGILGLLASFLVYLLRGFSELSLLNIALSLTAGILYLLAIFLYFKSAKIEEISRVVPLFYLTSLFVAILAAVFLGEIFTPTKYFGIFLLVVGAILLSSRNLVRVSVGKALWLMTLASLMLSITTVITKYLLKFAHFWTVFSYTRIGAALGLVPVFCFNLHHFFSVTKERGKRVVATISLNESLNLLGILLVTVAMAMGPVTLVNALSSVQPFFVLLLTVVLSVFYPRVLKEEVDRSTVLSKLVAIILMFLGAFLVV